MIVLTIFSLLSSIYVVLESVYFSAKVDSGCRILEAAQYGLFLFAGCYLAGEFYTVLFNWFIFRHLNLVPVPYPLPSVFYLLIWAITLPLLLRRFSKFRSQRYFYREGDCV